MRSNNSFIKKQKAEDKRKKRQAKLDKKHSKTKESNKGSWQDMIAYVDKNGNITTDNPDDLSAPKIKIV